jgi:hypothetical protein
MTKIRLVRVLELRGALARGLYNGIVRAFPPPLPDARPAQRPPPHPPLRPARQTVLRRLPRDNQGETQSHPDCRAIADNIARARELLAVPTPHDHKADADAVDPNEPSTPSHPCPCCDGRMITIEIHGGTCSDS